MHIVITTGYDRKGQSDMVHTRDLSYFLAVSEHLHITRAAASLFITQPALSKQIASLEKQLGSPLLLRRPDGVALTPAGEALLPFARQMVDLDRQAALAVQRAARVEAKLTIGFWLSPAADVLSDVVTAFTTAHPELRLRLRAAGWAEIGAGVTAGQADVALVQTPHDRPIPGLRHHRLAVEDLVLAVRDTHRLAGRDSISFADLAGETLFVLPQEAGPLSGAQAAPPGMPMPSLEPVTTIDETIEGVATGLGVCVLTPSVLAAHPHLRVRSVPMVGMAPGDYHVVWRQADDQTAAIRDLVQVIVSAHRVARHP